MLGTRTTYGWVCRRSTPILTRSDQQGLPPASRLESTTLHLEARGDLRTLICFVERWSEQAQPTGKARLAQARALVSLGLMDRAWTRLQDLVESGQGGPEAAAVAARMFLKRGWVKQARTVLQRAMADHPDNPALEALWEQATAPPAAPDLTAAESDGAPPSALLAAVDHYMATGAFVRARGLLERLRRQGHDDPRVGDLLWALEGDFRLSGSLASLANTHGPDLGDLADLADEAEHTAEADRVPGVVDRELGEAQASFPLLFRHMEGRTEQYRGVEEPEVTQLSSMAEIDEMRRAAMEHTETGSDDTQIMRVIHKHADGTAEPERPNETSTFDLSVLRREIESKPGPDSDLTDPAPEAEDDDLVIVTRKEVASEAPRGASRPVGLDLEVEPDPAPRHRVRLSDEDEAWARPEPPAAERRSPQAPAPPSAPADIAEDDADETSSSAIPWGLIAMGTALVFVGGVVTLVVFIQILRSLLF